MLIEPSKQHKAMQDLKDISDGLPWYVDHQIDKLQSLYRSLDVSRRNQKINLQIQSNIRPPTHNQIRKRIVKTPFNQIGRKSHQLDLSQISRSLIQTAKSFNSHNHHHRPQLNITNTSKFFKSQPKRIKVKFNQIECQKNQPILTYTKLRKQYQKQFYVNGRHILQISNFCNPQKRTPSRNKRNGKVITGRPMFRINQKSIYL